MTTGLEIGGVCSCSWGGLPCRSPSFGSWGSFGCRAHRRTAGPFASLLALIVLAVPLHALLILLLVIAAAAHLL